METSRDTQAVQRAMLQEADATLLRLECERRGWIVTSYCQCEVCKRAEKGYISHPYEPTPVGTRMTMTATGMEGERTLLWDGTRWLNCSPLPAGYPPLADDDGLLPFEVKHGE